MLKSFVEFLTPLLDGHPHLVVALSGGLDSRVLLDLAVRLKAQAPQVTVEVVHVHHGLSDEADNWLAFCERCASENNLAFHGVRVQLERRGKGVEAAAREARYRALANFVTPQTLVLTGQHLDDQAETLLLALKRGAGPLGMAGMPGVQEFGEGLLVRPLLSQRRAALAAYAGERRLDWVEDDSNTEQIFDRNFLRHSILPPLESRWPGVSERFARSAELCQDLNSLADEVAVEDLAKATAGSGRLSLTALSALSPSRTNNLLRYWLRRQGLALPSRRQCDEIVHRLIPARDDAAPVVRFGDIQIRRFRGVLYAMPLLADIGDQVVAWQGETELALPDGLGCLVLTEAGGEGLRAPLPDERVTVRFAASGSLKCHPVGRDKSRSLKKLWQEYGVPPWQRGRTPLLFYNESLVWVGGGWTERAFAASANERGLVVNWRR